MYVERCILYCQDSLSVHMYIHNVCVHDVQLLWKKPLMLAKPDNCVLDDCANVIFSPLQQHYSFGSVKVTILVSHGTHTLCQHQMNSVRNIMVIPLLIQLLSNLISIILVGREDCGMCLVQWQCYHSLLLV